MIKIMFFLKKHILSISGILLGTLGGYCYFYFIGCSSGTCIISSNPYISALYGALIGYLLFGMFKKKRNREEDV